MVVMWFALCISNIVITIIHGSSTKPRSQSSIAAIVTCSTNNVLLGMRLSSTITLVVVNWVWHTTPEGERHVTFRIFPLGLKIKTWPTRLVVLALKEGVHVSSQKPPSADMLRKLKLWAYDNSVGLWQFCRLMTILWVYNNSVGLWQFCGFMTILCLHN